MLKGCICAAQVGAQLQPVLPELSTPHSLWKPVQGR